MIFLCTPKGAHRFTTPSDLKLFFCSFYFFSTSLDAPYVHIVPTHKLMHLSRVTYHLVQNGGGGIRLMNVIIILTASPFYFAV